MTEGKVKQAKYLVQNRTSAVLRKILQIRQQFGCRSHVWQNHRKSFSADFAQNLIVC